MTRKVRIAVEEIEPEEQSPPPSVIVRLDYEHEMAVRDIAILKESVADWKRKFYGQKAETSLAVDLIRWIAKEQHDLSCGTRPKDWHIGWKVVNRAVNFLQENGIAMVPEKRRVPQLAEMH